MVFKSRRTGSNKVEMKMNGRLLSEEEEEDNNKQNFMEFNLRHLECSFARKSQYGSGSLGPESFESLTEFLFMKRPRKGGSYGRIRNVHFGSS